MPQRLTKGWWRVRSGVWRHTDTQWMVTRDKFGPNKGYYFLVQGDFERYRVSREVVYCHTLIEAQRLVLSLTKWWPQDMKGGD